MAPHVSFVTLCFTPSFCSAHGVQFVGGIYAKSAKGRGLPQSRILYLDCSVPAKPIMHMAETLEDEGRVRSNYSWSWGEPKCKQTIAYTVHVAIYTTIVSK